MLPPLELILSVTGNLQDFVSSENLCFHLLGQAQESGRGVRLPQKEKLAYEVKFQKGAWNLCTVAIRNVHNKGTTVVLGHCKVNLTAAVVLRKTSTSKLLFLKVFNLGYVREV